MPSKKNMAQLQDIQSKIDQAKSVILASYQGLSMAEQDELRAKVKEVGGELIVSKNTLLKLALQSEVGELPEFALDALQGQTVVVYGYEDAVSATKALVDFTKEHKQIDVKMGVLTGSDDAKGSLLSVVDIKSLAELPSKHELRAHLVAQLNAPISGFVNVLAGNLRGLVNVVQAIKEQKES